MEDGEGMGTIGRRREKRITGREEGDERDTNRGAESGKEGRLRRPWRDTESTMYM